MGLPAVLQGGVLQGLAKAGAGSQGRPARPVEPEEPHPAVEMAKAAQIEKSPRKSEGFF